jgi:hypothetical protein
MSTRIRKTVKSDLASIVDLFQGRKKVDELHWIFSNPYNEAEYNSFVALNDENEIIGVIGYTADRYVYGDKKFTGALAFNWSVLDKYRGFASVKLLQEVYKSGDFGFGLHGSEYSLPIYKVVNLHYYSDFHILVKMIDPLGYLVTLNKSVPKKILKTLFYLPGIFNRPGKDEDPSIRITPFDGQAIQDNGNTGVFRLEETDTRIKWLMKCPIVDAYGFQVKRGNTPLGVIVLYIRKETRRGEIVYVSHFGEDIKAWNTVITFAIKFFRVKKCCAISAMASNQTFIRILKKHLFMNDKHTYKWFVKDPRGNLINIPLNTWHLTFGESDRATSFLNF